MLEKHVVILFHVGLESRCPKDPALLESLEASEVVDQKSKIMAFLLYMENLEEFVILI